MSVKIFRVSFLQNNEKEEKFFYDREEAKNFLLDKYTEEFLSAWRSKNIPMKQSVHLFRSKLPEYTNRCDDVEDHIAEGTI